MRTIFIKTASIVLLTLCLAAVHTGTASATLTVKANHDYLKVDYNFHGSTVSLKGLSDPGVDLVFTVLSGDTHQKLKEKNRVGGILWMNSGDVVFEHIPNVYYLRSTREPKDILGEEELAKNEIGYPALLERAEIDAAEELGDRKSLFDEFIKYKEATRLYSVSYGGVELSEEGNVQKYGTVINWPYQIPPGEYKVIAHAVKGGRIVESAETKVIVERAGIVKRLADMAQNKGAQYGVVAIVIAIMAGFGAGLIFGKGGGAH